MNKVYKQKVREEKVASVFWIISFKEFKIHMETKNATSKEKKAEQKNTSKRMT